jgi:hypothetical protein
VAVVSVAGAMANEARIRTLIAIAAAGTAAGIALAVLNAAAVGSFVTVGSLGLLVHSLHRFGRVGADERGRHRRRGRGRRGDERPADDPVGRSRSRRR